MVTMIGSFALMSALTVIPYPQHVVTAKGAFALPMDRVEKSDVSWRRDASIPAEGYRLSVTPNGVTAGSSDDAGAFYALQTLKQMARPQDRTVEVEVTEVFQGSIRLERLRRLHAQEQRKLQAHHQRDDDDVHQGAHRQAAGLLQSRKRPTTQ